MTTKLGTMLLCGLLILPFSAQSQPTNLPSPEDVRWKSEQQVRALYGEPQTVTAPVGTHATYTLWRYEGFTVAFADNKAFHLFPNDSLRKVDLNNGSDS